MSCIVHVRQVMTYDVSCQCVTHTATFNWRFLKLKITVENLSPDKRPMSALIGSSWRKKSRKFRIQRQKRLSLWRHQRLHCTIAHYLFWQKSICCTVASRRARAGNWLTFIALLSSTNFVVKFYSDTTTLHFMNSAADRILYSFAASSEPKATWSVHSCTASIRPRTQA